MPDAAEGAKDERPCEGVRSAPGGRGGANPRQPSSSETGAPTSSVSKKATKSATKASGREHETPFGQLTNAEGTPVAIEAFAGNTAGPSTFMGQVE